MFKVIHLYTFKIFLKLVEKNQVGSRYRVGFFFNHSDYLDWILTLFYECIMYGMTALHLMSQHFSHNCVGVKTNQSKIKTLNEILFLVHF